MDLAPAKPVVCYEHERPGNLLHFDANKRGCKAQRSDRATGDRRDKGEGAGWDMLFVAVDHMRASPSRLTAH